MKNKIQDITITGEEFAVTREARTFVTDRKRQKDSQTQWFPSAGWVVGGLGFDSVSEMNKPSQGNETG